MNNFFLSLLRHINLLAFRSAVAYFDHVGPVIKFVESIKFFVNAEGAGKFELPDFKFIDYITEHYKLSELLIKRLVDAFVNTIKSIIPDIDKDFTEEQHAQYDLYIILAFANYVKTLSNWNKDMIYLKLASTMLIYLFSKNGDVLKDHEAMTMVQLAYSNNKV